MTSSLAAFDQLPSDATAKVSPFKIAIKDDALKELHTLLSLSKLAPITYEGLQDRRYGAPYDWLKKARSAWLDEFDWRKHETNMNSFPQFTTVVGDDDGKNYTVHFAALFSQKEDAIPLLCLHGWPGSFLEFLPIMSILRERYTPETLPYHIVAPSLPGFAFSSPPPLDRNFQMEDVARLMNKLMISLGFARGYTAQGGDIGSKVSRVLAVSYEACKVNFCIMPEPANPIGAMDDIEKKGVEKAAQFKRSESAYALFHATKPATIGYVLAANPLSLLAWIGEKFLAWTDQDPPLEVILESVSLYWLTETFPTSIYTYRQSYTPGSVSTAHESPDWYIKAPKPFGYSYFPMELAPIPRSWVATTGNLVFHRLHHSGGHFAALERPDVLLKDVEDFLAEFWPRC
ncbi:MAG: hypothetical protein Q9190_003836 [Brigantiaea leucoxantha]